MNNGVPLGCPLSYRPPLYIASKHCRHLVVSLAPLTMNSVATWMTSHNTAGILLTWRQAMQPALWPEQRSTKHWVRSSILSSSQPSLATLWSVHARKARCSSLSSSQPSLATLWSVHARKGPILSFSNRMFHSRNVIELPTFAPSSEALPCV